MVIIKYNELYHDFVDNKNEFFTLNTGYLVYQQRRRCLSGEYKADNVKVNKFTIVFQKILV